MTNVIDGKKLAAELRENIARRVKVLKEQAGITVGLAVVLVGENPASQVYVRNKVKACEEAGIQSFAYYLPTDTTQCALNELLEGLAVDPAVHGILVQLPLPQHLDAEQALAKIPVEKDVDGFSEENIGRLCMGRDCLVACTPNGVMKMLESARIPLRGKNAVVLGRSNIVGKPMAMLLCNADATVTICHSKTENLKEICRRADILIAAIGKAEFIKADMVKEGAVVIDVGMNRKENGRLCGDVAYDEVAPKCSYISPVPGGVGPMTITMLMDNACRAAEKIAARR